MEKAKETIHKTILKGSESIALFLAFLDQYELSLFFISFSTLILMFDLKYKFIEKEDLLETFKHYWSFPVILVAFYILFGTYSKSNLKFIILLAGYASLRTLHVYFKKR